MKKKSRFDRPSHEVSHPAATIFPMMAKADLEELARDISAQGQREPIAMIGKEILDGRNRWDACRMAGVVPLTFQVDVEHHEGEAPFDPVTFVLSANLHRRHLTESQRAMIGARAMDLYKAEAKKRQRDAGKATGRGNKKVQANLPEPFQARDEAAAAVKVSGRSVQNAETVLKKGSPELVEMVDSGEVAVSRAATIARKTPENEQAEKAKMKPARKKKESTPGFTEGTPEAHVPASGWLDLDGDDVPSDLAAKQVESRFADLPIENKVDSLWAMFQKLTSKRKSDFIGRLRDGGFIDR